jgi:hypothetical protein
MLVIEWSRLENINEALQIAFIEVGWHIYGMII